MFESLVNTNICQFRLYITFQYCPCTFRVILKNIFKAVIISEIILKYFYEHNGESIGATLETYVLLELSVCIKHGIINFQILIDMVKIKGNIFDSDTMLS